MINNSGLLDKSSTLLTILPEKPWCSYDKKLRFVLPAGRAVEMPYIQLNHPACAWALCIDLDTETEEPCFPWESADLPAPSYSVWNKENGHSHLIWILDAPVFRKSHDGWRLRRIAESFKNALSADKAITYQMNLVKNPLHEKWKTYEIGYTYSLDCLEEASAGHYSESGKIKKSKGELAIIAAFGRNCGLFEVVRKEAYSMVKSCKSENELWDKVTACLRLFNGALQNPYTIYESDMRSIPKSIAKWTWSHRHGFGNKRDTDTGHAEESALPVSAYAKQAREKMKNKEKVITAVRELQKEGKKISAAEIDRHINQKKKKVGLLTIKKYLKDIIALDFPIVPYQKPGSFRGANGA